MELGHATKFLANGILEPRESTVLRAHHAFLIEVVLLHYRRVGMCSKAILNGCDE